MKDTSSGFSSVLFLAVVAAIGGFLFGFDSGVINGTVTALEQAFGSGTALTGFNVASMLLGCAVGAFGAGYMADRFGRRSTLIITAVVFAVSSYGSGIADDSLEFIIYRVLGGLAVGAASIICPAYIAEIAPPAYRGRLATLQQMAIVLGLFFAFLSNFILAKISGGASEVWLWGYQTWQWMFWVEIIPSIVFFVGLLRIPESPRYLVAAGRFDEAEAVFDRIHRGQDSKALVAEISRTLEKGKKPSMRDLFNGKGRIYPIVWVGICVAGLQQLVGINVVFYYGAVLWRAAGFSENNALMINVLSGVINIGATVIAISLIDRVGRKPLLIVGSVLMTVFLVVLTVVFSLASTGADGTLHLGPTAGIIALVAANLYIIGFGISWGPIMWVLLGEIFPNKMRGAALSIAGLCQWGANFLVTITFPVLLSHAGLGGAYGIYALFAAFSAFYAWKYIAETKGKSLEDMQSH